MTQKPLPRELFTKLADYYEAHPERWLRDGDRTSTCFCVLHGLEHFAGPLKTRLDVSLKQAVVADLARAIKAETNKTVETFNIAWWNDNKAKDVAEVVAVLRRAAAL